MATDVERLAVLIEANTKSYERAMARIEQRTNTAIRSSTRSVRSLDAALTGAMATARSFATAFGAGAIAGGLASIPMLFRQIVADGARLGDTAEKIGITAKALQELEFQAKQNGSTAEELGTSLDQFSRRIGLAATGTGELLRILNANGIALRDQQGNLRPLTTLLADYADLIKNAANEQDRAVLTTEAFGRGGAAMGVVFADGAHGIAAAREEVERLGIAIEDVDVEKLREIDDAFQRLTDQLAAGLKRQVVLTIEAFDFYEERFKRIPQIAADAWAGAEEFYNKLFSISPADAAKAKLTAALNRQKVTGDFGTDEDFSLRFAQAAKGDLPGRAIARTNIPSRAREGDTAEREATKARRAAITALTAELQRAKDRMQEFGDVGRNVLGGLIDDFKSGVSAAESFTNALSGIADQLLNLALNSAFGLLGGGLSPAAAAQGKSGFAGLFAEGGTIPSGKWGIVGERGPEYIRGPAAIAPMTKGAAGGDAVTISVNVNGARGNAEIRQMVNAGVRDGLVGYDRTKQRQQLTAA